METPVLLGHICIGGSELKRRNEERFDEAERFYKELVTLSEKLPGSRLDSALMGLAYLLANQERSEEAKPYFLRALDVRKKKLGPNHPELADTYDSVARNFLFDGYYGECEELYRRALAIREKVLGPNHLKVASSLRFLAAPISFQGRYAEGISLVKRSLAICKRADANAQPSLIDSLNCLTRMYALQGLRSGAAPDQGAGNL